MEAQHGYNTEREIDYIIEHFHGRYDFVDILPLVARRYSAAILDSLLERIHAKWAEFPAEKQVFVTQFIVSLGRR